MSSDLSSRSRLTAVALKLSAVRMTTNISAPMTDASANRVCKAFRVPERESKTITNPIEIAKEMKTHRIVFALIVWLLE